MLFVMFAAGTKRFNSIAKDMNKGIIGISVAAACIKTVLTIQAHVLGKGLRQQNVVALPDEVAHGPGIAVGVPAGKTLVRHVEKDQQVPLLKEIRKTERR